MSAERSPRAGAGGLILAFAIGSSLGTHAEPVGAQGEATFATEWILVRLRQPIAVDAATDGNLPLETGVTAVDALIRESGVHRIEPALRVSAREPGHPESFRRHGLDRTYAFHVPAGSDLLALVDRFAALPGVELAEPDYVGTGGATLPNDPLRASQWGLDQPSDVDVDAPEAWDHEAGGAVVLAILDSGIDSDHEDLAAKIAPGFDFVNGDGDPEDDHGHGTNVSSIAAAITNNATGVAGTCWNCRIMPLKVLDSNNNGFYSDWADAMVWAADHGARVINLSAGGTTPSATLRSGVRYAHDAGVIHVSITHNANANIIYYPGRYAETIAVGATDSIDRRVVPFCYSPTSGSNYGNEIDVVAPGELILGAARGGGYNSWCGTSQAAPLVAGLVGIMETIYPSIGREEARYLLEAGAEDLVGRVAEDGPGFDIYHGWGRVNMDRTVRATAASISLRVEGVSATRPYLEIPNPMAQSYDFVRGDLASLSESAAGVDAGTLVCIENDSTDPDTNGNEDFATPSAGEGFFYLARFNAAPPPGWGYGGSSSNRDRLPFGTGDCPGCGNDVIEVGETCDGTALAGQSCASLGFGQGNLSCVDTCDGFDTSGCSICGNDICEVGAGEDCLSCPDDCNGLQSGSPADRYCCGDGAGEKPVRCDDPRCTANGNTCRD